MSEINGADAAGGPRLGGVGLSKSFGPLKANDRIDFAARRGTIHAIVGGNGAGKSTLMKILQGLQAPDAGTVLVNGAPVVFRSPNDAIRAGIGMVHQEFTLIPGLTLLENLILGDEPRRAFGAIDRRVAGARAAELADLAGVRIDWTLMEEEAPVHMRQAVEILRLIYRGADVLILDEPTAVLAPPQIRELLALMANLRDQGNTILFISHKLDEVLAVADEVTVLRTGRVVVSRPAAGLDKAELARLMTGEPVTAPTAKPATPGAAVLELDGLGTGGEGAVALEDFSLVLHAGEIVGIAGVAGNGQDQIVGLVSGLMPTLRGRLRLAGQDITQHSTRERRALGLAYLSPDRKQEGLCLEASIAENLIASHQRKPRFGKAGFLNPIAIAGYADERVAAFDIKCASPQQPVGALSGGNQQKVAMARELYDSPRVLLACQPTRGVDIKGIAAIHQEILAFRDAGGAVLLISEELEELVQLSDRIVTIYGGRRTGEFPRGAAAMERIGRTMLGEVAA
ncbi:MAG: ABC transporter ATP-binding protein [Rhodobacteraceae bacterium]|jgi:ABC-type uncharacterized transport system ATPase subunit|nr:ABC transporter ATP-binding protein [Paracoccaceae bacterium]